MSAGLLVALAVLCWPSRRALVSAAVTRRGGAEAGDRPTAGRSTWSRPRFPPAASRLLERRRRRSSRSGASLPLLEAMAAALRTGLPTPDALLVSGEAVSAVERRRILEPVLAAAREGRSVGAVWRRVAGREADPDLAAVARAWSLSERTGAPLADALTTAAAVSRAGRAHRQRVASATAGARATCALLSLLPVGGVAVGLVLGLTPSELYSSRLAQASLVLGVVVLVIGRWTVERMVSRVTEGKG